ncbi:hypothetical protein L7F22_009300 [Adiantum nelumboides]|nr:hypothetical protein [Adiantum nelumboides]
MNDEADPALQFFPDGKVDLYGALGINKESTEEEIKKAYRKAALKYHPDKQQKGVDEIEKQNASKKFQQIGYAYSVLSTPARKSRYDSTGRTDESMFEEAMDWNAYFKELWTGEVNADTLDEFKKKYQRSKDEREDILEAYKATQGHLAEMVDHVPYMSLRIDRERVEKIIEDAIKEKEIKRLKQWDKTRKDKSLIQEAERKEENEEVEAMEMAREMAFMMLCSEMKRQKQNLVRMEKEKHKSVNKKMTKKKIFPVCKI